MFHHTARHGRRGDAYLAIARRIGRSPVWVRKLIGRQGGGLDANVYWAIVDAYKAHRARLEAKADDKWANARKIMEEANALRAGRHRPDGGEPR